MKPLFDFGISQEDTYSEQTILDLKPGDRVLCIASGGEVPLNLLCTNKNIQVDAIDISETQLALCRLKLLTTLNIQAPENAAFLGYSEMHKKKRREIFTSVLLPLLKGNDKEFWLSNLKAIENGVINSGRFELFINKIRRIAMILIGKKNVESLIRCSTLQQQEELFNEKISSRKGVRYLFKIAFHPSVYKKRGIDERGLTHATSKTGEIFFQKFRAFCTSTKANENYFLQYYLTGSCNTSALPDFLKPEFQSCLKSNMENIQFKKIAITEMLNTSPAGFYNKVHVSNIGDWMKENDFKELMNTLQKQLPKGGKVCCRVLQKNHFAKLEFPNIHIDKNSGDLFGRKDRFPFCSLFRLTIQ